MLKYCENWALSLGGTDIGHAPCIIRGEVFKAAREVASDQLLGPMGRRGGSGQRDSKPRPALRQPIGALWVLTTRRVCSPSEAICRGRMGVGSGFIAGEVRPQREGQSQLVRRYRGPALMLFCRDLELELFFDFWLKSG